MHGLKILDLRAEQTLACAIGEIMFLIRFIHGFSAELLLIHCITPQSWQLRFF